MPQLEVWLEDETIWLTQRQMSELFGYAMENIIHHLKNIYAEDELTEAATTKEFFVVRFEGKRQVSRNLKHYNLDAIISVGYWVNSKRGVKFRHWATAVRQDIEKTKKRLIRKADAGDIDAMLDYCGMYPEYELQKATGDVCKRVLRYLRTAARRGNAAALCNLGAAYYGGSCLVKCDFTKAVKYYEASAAAKA